MEDDGRPFEPVKIGMASAETGRERFVRDGDGQIPYPAFWRLNLTALSNVYNLYFVAIGGHIHVYEPQFPFQKLGGRQGLTIIPQLANARAPGYINPHHPHYINNLIVGRLGKQEILLLSTDSGNVTGYETRSLFNALRDIDVATSSGAPPSTYADVRPFFSQWVVESAWGLAIHSSARMIAVSANSSTRNAAETMGIWEQRGSITVFAFALVSESSEVEAENSMNTSHQTLDVDPEWHVWRPNLLIPAAMKPDRHHNYKIVLAGSGGHPTNIPHIAFINSREDSAGSWLLSTDVDENIKLWQIWAGKCVHTWEFRDRGSNGAAWLGVEERGWFAIALDRQAFQPVSNVESLIGHHRAPQYYGHHAQGDSFDITNVVRHHVPSNAWNHPHYASDGDESDVSAENEDAQVAELLSDSENSGDSIDAGQNERTRNELTMSTSYFDNAQDNTSTNDMDMDLDTEQLNGSFYVEEPSEDSSDDEDNLMVRSDFSEGNASEHNLNDDDDTLRIGSETPITGLRSEISQVYNSDPDRSDAAAQQQQDSNQERTTRHSLHRSATGETPGAGARRPPSIPHVPFLYCSSSHLRLFDSINAKSPHLFCARLLKQSISTAMEDQGIFQMDRLNMVEQIPELGIVIIATQVGRCAVCSLTKRKTDNLLGLRVDWVLPTGKQERAGQRPHLPLHGLAVSPIQGRYPRHVTSQVAKDAKLWARDRVVDGVNTMFDQTTLDMSDTEKNTHNNLDGGTNNMEISSAARGPLTNGMTVKPFDWASCQAPEPWQNIDGRRRYRLMMTYADMTVLTYEIARGVEREDTRPASKS